MEITASKIAAIGLFKEGALAAIVVQNGKPTHYEVKEMDNKAVENLYEVNKASYVQNVHDETGEAGQQAGVN